MNKFDDFIEPLIEREGGEKIVVDTGGTTKYGISEKGTGLSPDEIKSLTKGKPLRFIASIIMYHQSAIGFLSIYKRRFLIAL